jgi:hypothetical protein
MTDANRLNCSTYADISRGNARYVAEQVGGFSKFAEKVGVVDAEVIYGGAYYSIRLQSIHRCAHCKTSLFTQADERPPTLIGAGKFPFLIDAYTLLRDFPQIDNTSFNLIKHNSDELNSTVLVSFFLNVRIRGAA